MLVNFPKDWKIEGKNVWRRIRKTNGCDTSINRYFRKGEPKIHIGFSGSVEFTRDEWDSFCKEIDIAFNTDPWDVLAEKNKEKEKLKEQKERRLLKELKQKYEE